MVDLDGRVRELLLRDGVTLEQKVVLSDGETAAKRRRRRIERSPQCE